MVAMTNHQLLIAADVGGTFTDLVMVNSDGGLWLEKLPSTPPNFEIAVLQGIRNMLRVSSSDGSSVTRVAHGTTVATNAILEHRGARTALLTTRGFRDVLERAVFVRLKSTICFFRSQEYLLIDMIGLRLVSAFPLVVRY